jgi:tetratricopeptide (TPR) repeat protein
LLCHSAKADEDPDTEAARRLFERGLQHYNAREYDQAIVEFEKARAIKPTPALDFNIGRAYDRMAKYDEAVAAYRRYVEAKPEQPDAADVRSRMELLEKRVHPQAVVVEKQAAPPKKRAWVIPVAVVAAVAIVGVAVGVGVGLGTAPSDPSASFAVHWK